MVLSPKLKRAARVCGALLVAVLLALGGLALAFALRFGRGPPAPGFAPPRDAAEARLQDLAYLKRLPERDRSFSPEALAAFTRFVAAAEARAGAMTAAELELVCAEAAALADNGHTAAGAYGSARRVGRVPLRFYWFDDGLYVVRAAAAHAELVSARVRSIDGHAPEELWRGLRKTVGGNDGRFLEVVPYLLESPALLHAAGLAAAEGRFTLAATTLAGAEVTRTVEALPPAPDVEVADAWRELLPDAEPGESPPWSAVAPAGGAPLWLRDPDRAFLHQPLAGGAYLRLTRNDSAPGQSIEAFSNDALAAVRAARPRFVIVDLRLDGGGDYTATARFTRELPAAFAGPLYILVGRETFSAGIVTAARLKHFGGARARLIGEPMGDRPRFWAEGRRFVLPNSKIGVSYATGYHDWEDGCTSPLRCYWVNVLMGVAAGSLEPERVPLRFADLRAGRDPALELALEQARTAAGALSTH